MKGAINIVFGFVALVAVGCDTSGNVDPVFEDTYIKYYGFEGNQTSADLLVDGDGNFLLLGNSLSPAGEKRSFVIKTDPKGTVIHERKIGGPNHTAVDIELIKSGPYSGGYIIGMNYEDGQKRQIKLLRLDVNGNSIDSVLVPLHEGGQRQFVRSVTSLTTGGEFVITGMADGALLNEADPINSSNDVSDILAFRLNSSLAVIDNIVSKGGEMNGCGIRVAEMSGANEGKLVLFSYTDRPNLTDAFGYNFSYDILYTGTPVGKLIGGEEEQEFLAEVVPVAQSNGSGFLMAGTARSNSNAGGPGQIYLVRYDEEFQRKALDVRVNLDGNFECVSADNAPTGFYLLANQRQEGELKDVTIVKVNQFGIAEWTRSFGTRQGDDTAGTISVLPDGRIVILASLQLQIGKKLALIVINSNGSF